MNAGIRLLTESWFTINDISNTLLMELKKGDQMFTTLTTFQKFWILVTSLIIGYYASTVTLNWFFPRSSLNVVGVGKVSVVPEKVSFIVSRVNSGSDVVRMLNEGEAGIKSLINTTRSIAGTDAEIKKSFYRTVPPSGTQTLYQVVNAFSVTANQVDKINELIKSLYLEGATTVSNVSFESSNKSLTEQQARELAVKDAKAQAQRIAKAAGKRLGKLISINDDNSSATSTIGTDSQSGAALSLDEIEIVKKVSVVYEVW